MRFRPHPVKHSSNSGQTAPIVARWLEGWAVVFPSVGIALLSTWLALPQGTMPDYLPMPTLRQDELATLRREVLTARQRVQTRPLEYELRRVGELMRQLGRQWHQGESVSVAQRERLRGLVRAVRAKVGDEPLNRLRAVQSQLFLLALNTWDKTGVESEDAIELGGDFLIKARQLGWLEGPADCTKPIGVSSNRCVLSLDQDERAALFLNRWTELASSSGDDQLHIESAWKLLALRARLKQPLRRLGVEDLRLIDRMARADPSYPGALAKGLLLVRLGDRQQAIEAFRAQLEAHPNGPFALRARNHLVYAIEMMNGDGT